LIGICVVCSYVEENGLCQMKMPKNKHIKYLFFFKNEIKKLIFMCLKMNILACDNYKLVISQLKKCMYSYKNT